MSHLLAAFHHLHPRLLSFSSSSTGSSSFPMKLSNYAIKFFSFSLCNCFATALLCSANLIWLTGWLTGASKPPRKYRRKALSRNRSQASFSVTREEEEGSNSFYRHFLLLYSNTHCLSVCVPLKHLYTEPWLADSVPCVNLVESEEEGEGKRRSVMLSVPMSCYLLAAAASWTFCW